jgi:protein-S-isoprenylcysteine O-methyltransferase Ste14
MNANIKDFFIVLLQLSFLALFVLIGQWNARFMDPYIQIVGYLSILFGFLVFLLGIYQLRTYISIFPTPVRDGELITTGIYKYIRHPMYTGLFFVLIGYGAVSLNFYRLLIAIVIILIVLEKVEYEENRLMEKYRKYKDYKVKTGKFISKLF